MIYLIYGQDLEKLNYWLDKIKFEKDYERISLDYQINKDFTLENLYTPPMLSQKRLVIFENRPDFEKIEFSKIHPRVDIVILEKNKFAPKLPKIPNIFVIEAKKVPQIFKFLDNLTTFGENEGIGQTLKILKSEDPNFVFSLIITHFRRLILVKNSNFYSKLNLVDKLASWQIRKYQKISEKLNFAQLKTAFKLLLATEIEVKTGKKELQKQLPILVLKLTQLFKTA